MQGAFIEITQQGQACHHIRDAMAVQQGAQSRVT